MRISLAAWGTTREFRWLDKMDDDLRCRCRCLFGSRWKAGRAAEGRQLCRGANFDGALPDSAVGALPQIPQKSHPAQSLGLLTFLLAFHGTKPFEPRVSFACLEHKVLIWMGSP